MENGFQPVPLSQSSFFKLKMVSATFSGNNSELVFAV